MCITLSQFKNNISKYMTLAQLVDIIVVDLENGRFWIISRGDSPKTKPKWYNLLPELIPKEQPVTMAGNLCT